MQGEIELPIFKVPIWKFHFHKSLAGTLQGIEASYFLTEAENKTQARLSLTNSENFWKNYNQLSVEERKKLYPFKLKREGKIERILDCSIRHKNSLGEYICGKPMSDFGEEPDFNGEFGICCIMKGYDPLASEQCPYYKED